MDQLMLGVGCLDGKSMIEMNNLSVGYVVGVAPEIGVYPPSQVVPVVPQEPELPPVVEQPDSQTKS